MSNKKPIFKINTLKKLLNDENSCVTLVQTTRLLGLPPFFLNDMKSGILYLLNNMLKKYDRSLGGIIIGYQNIKVLMDENTGIIPMGTSETEVNIFVEFYIFQPKIGSYLEGVVNKKSNSHIGCLVHKYFNATILKPEDIDYDNWICQDLNVDDKIIFKVKDLDFTCLLPLIEGVINDETFLKKVKSNLNGSFDLSNDIVNNLNKRSPKVLFTEEYSENNEESLGDKELTSNNLNKEFIVSEKYHVKKKKKKNNKQKNEDVENTQDRLNVTGDSIRCLFPKEAEDEIFYSTQLLAVSPGKMKICCSPITKNTSFEERRQKSDFKNQNELHENEKKQKYKKRKREEQKEPESFSKKIKNSHSLFSEKESTKDKINSDEDKSLVEIMIKELCRKQLNKIEEDFSKSDKETSKEREKKIEKPNNELKKILHFNKDKKGQINRGSGTGQNSEACNMLDELREQEIQKVKKELNISDKKNCKEIKKIKAKVKEKEKKIVREKMNENLLGLKKSTKTLNGTGDGVKKFSVQEMMDQLLKQELNRVKQEYKKSDSKSTKIGKKTINKHEEASMKKPQNSLYEKLLKEAKNSVDMEEKKPSSLPFAGELEKKKKKGISNLAKKPVKLKGLVEKSDFNFQNTKDCGETYEKYKNGSMYDPALTPEKVNFEKSLFSDSELSYSSPPKKEKKGVGIEVKFIEQSPINLQVDGVKNGSGGKKKRRSDKSEKEQNHLYEKLLKEAKSLIRSSNEFPSRKKKKNILPSKKSKHNECKS